MQDNQRNVVYFLIFTTKILSNFTVNPLNLYKIPAEVKIIFIKLQKFTVNSAK